MNDADDVISLAKKQVTPLDIRSRALWLLGSCLEIIDGVLYYRWVTQSEQKPCLVVSHSLRADVLKHCHDSKVAGYLGQQKTIERVKQSFLWYHLHSNCVEYVRSCNVCNQNKKANVKPRAALTKFHAGFPMERIHLDILGNKYILMMIDQFTKWQKPELLSITPRQMERWRDITPLLNK